MSETKTTIGIISIGDMGSGLARLLTTHGYTVVTNITGRSEDTHTRARSAGVGLLPTDTALVSSADLILSVVPPADARATAQRIHSAVSSLSPPRTTPLYFADMNAVSPSTVKTIASLFSPDPNSLPPDDADTTKVRFIDGSILGGPPVPPPSSSTSSEWKRPLLPLSGPHHLTTLSPALAQLLNTRHISETIGSASSLKMCFASLSKGFSAVAVQAVTTAKRLGILDELKDAVREVNGVGTLERVERSVVGVGGKSGRWVREMEEISKTHSGEGEGEETFSPEHIFKGAAEVFRTVAEDTVLGQEKVGKRMRGTTIDDFADAMVEGLREKRRKRSEE